MKKVSTASTKQSRIFSRANLTIGLDLGDRSSCYCVLDEGGSIVMEQKSLPPRRRYMQPLESCRAAGWRCKPEMQDLLDSDRPSHGSHLHPKS